MSNKKIVLWECDHCAETQNTNTEVAPVGWGVVSFNFLNTPTGRATIRELCKGCYDNFLRGMK